MRILFKIILQILNVLVDYHFAIMSPFTVACKCCAVLVKNALRQNLECNVPLAEGMEGWLGAARN